MTLAVYRARNLGNLAMVYLRLQGWSGKRGLGSIVQGNDMCYGVEEAGDRSSRAKGRRPAQRKRDER